MILSLAGKMFRIEEVHRKPNGKIEVMIDINGRCIVSFPRPNGDGCKMYICGRDKARELWRKAI